MTSGQLRFNMTNITEDEEAIRETHKIKVSDSGYCQSQRSNSSKSGHSSSSGSSGYCGHPSNSTIGSSGDENMTVKKQKMTTGVEDASVNEFTAPHPANKIVEEKETPIIDPVMLVNMSSPSIQSEALQVAVLAQTLYCIQTEEQCLEVHDVYSPQVNKDYRKTELSNSDFNKDETKHEKEFCIVVTLSDGTVVCTTPALTKVLGFPKDMWKGRSLITFMHPKDRLAFAGHITSAMAESQQKGKNKNCNNQKEQSDYFYCWIRLYHGLKTSFNVTDKKATYLPCQLEMTFKEVPGQGVYLVATARVVKPAYQVPNEEMVDPLIFSIRHKANTLISHVDNDIVSYIGYRPHDMIGRSVLDFFCFEDLKYMRDIYSSILNQDGVLFKSSSMSFRCQNEDSVSVETEWSSFINPWSQHLEFIIGRLKIVKGPHNPDVVSPVLNTDQHEEQEEEKCEAVKNDIKVLLNALEEKVIQPGHVLKNDHKVIFVPRRTDMTASGPYVIVEAASEMLGEISPHLVYSDSKSSSETPSYNQLTYNENIHRFFASGPKTAHFYEFPDKKNERNQSSSNGGEEIKSKPKHFSIPYGSGKSSLNNASVQLQSQVQTTAQAERSTDSENHEYSSRPLTTQMLFQHNENMNKQMAQKHKIEKTKNQINKKHHQNFKNKTEEENEQEDQSGHGTKRSVSNSWEGEPTKTFKSNHKEQPAMTSHNTLQPDPPPVVWRNVLQPLAGHMNQPNLLVNPVIPCVYVKPLPAAAPATPTVCPLPLAVVTQPGPPALQHHPPPVMPAPAPLVAHQVQYMPSLMYQLPLVPMVYTQPHIISPVKPRMSYMTKTSPAGAFLQPQPSSATNSVIGEPGSARCSFASASLTQELSDSSKKENKTRRFSPAISPNGTSNTGKTKAETFDNELTHDDTSYCSDNSMFPKTEKSDDSMKGIDGKESDDQSKSWHKMDGPSNTHLRAIRKDPSWMENVELTPDLLMRYQLDSGSILDDVLKSDWKNLIKFNQSDIVNEQLDQLYVSLDEFSKDLAIEASFPSSGTSGSSGDEKTLVTAGIASTSTASYVKSKKRRRFMSYEKYSMIFEENAPLPPSMNEIVMRMAQST